MSLKSPKLALIVAYDCFWTSGGNACFISEVKSSDSGSNRDAAQALKSARAIASALVLAA